MRWVEAVLGRTRMGARGGPNRPVVTHSRSLEDIQRAFALLEAYEDGVGKLVIRPDGAV